MTREISAFIVDDEPLALRRLQRLLGSDPDVRITGAFSSAVEASAAASVMAPQLAILDVRMPLLDGFELLTTWARRGVQPYTIFATAYEDRALDAFGTGAVDYLLKPFDDERFARSIERAKRLIRAMAHDVSAAPTTVRAGMDTILRDRLLLSQRGTVTVVPMRDIEFVQAAARNVKIHAAGRCHIFRQSLSTLEARLDPAYFVRVHRSVLVNVEYIVKMIPLLHGDCELVLQRGTRLPLSRRYRDHLRPYLLAERGSR